MLVTIDIETYKKYTGNNDNNILKDTLTEEGKKYFNKNKKIGRYFPVLNSQEFIIGCVLQSDGEKRYFYNPQEMKGYLFELIEKNHKRGERTFIYGHNLSYDWNGIARDEYFNEHIKIINPSKLLMIYRIDRKSRGWFVDTMNFLPRSLDSIGKDLGEKKMEMPKHIDKIEDLKDYVFQDCNVLMKLMIEIREKMKKLGFKPSKMITAGQLAMTSFLSYIRKNEPYWLMMKKGEIYRGKNLEKCRPAFRGARNQVFKEGYFKEAYQIDINSLYPYIMQKMDFPDLSNEIYLENPLKDISLSELLNKKFIGVMECEIQAPKIKLGYLPIRFRGKEFKRDSMFFPTDCLLKGTWTTYEIKEALKLGYKLKEVNWAILYPKIDVNLFKNYINKLYKIRVESKDSFKLIIKLLMNNLFGKFAQSRFNKEYKIIKRYELSEYKEKGWIHSTTLKGDYIVYKTGKLYVPKYSNILISILITAYSRDYLYKQLKKINFNDLIYCDTDGIIFKNKKNLEKFKFSNKLGKWKLENKGECFIAKEKKYRIGETLKMSGVPKNLITKEVIDNEKEIKIKRRISFSEAVRNGDLYDEIGKFRDFNFVQDQDKKINVIFPEEIDERREWINIFDGIN